MLPDWWEPECVADPDLLADVELRVARFLGTPLATVRDPDAPLVTAVARGARLRKVKNIDADRLTPAIHAGLRVAEAVVRSLREPERAVSLPPRDPTAWWTALRATHGRVDLDVIVTDLWSRGIPVVHVGELPSPKYQGLACIVAARPVIVLGHEQDAPARLALFVAHEAAHITFGDCTASEPVVDEDEELPDTSDMESRADAYAWDAIAAGVRLPDLDGGARPKDVARRAAALESERGVDAGAVIWAWANRTRRFNDGEMALKALYLAQGGQHILRAGFERNVAVERASETDLGLLDCVKGSARRDAPAPG